MFPAVICVIEAFFQFFSCSVFCFLSYSLSIHSQFFLASSIALYISTLLISFYYLWRIKVRRQPCLPTQSIGRLNLHQFNRLWLFLSSCDMYQQLIYDALKILILHHHYV